MFPRSLSLLFNILLFHVTLSTAYVVRSRSLSHTSSTTRTATTLFARKGYEPKWKKKATLADVAPVKDLAEKGIKGTISVVFKQGNETKSTLASPGLPLRECAIQAGQFIKYGCGKGECGTCEALVDGKWVRPCIAVVPASLAKGEEYTIMVKELTTKKVSSGKFYSVRSFLFGFWNNLIGMVGFVSYRKAAKKNWEERKEYEDLIKQKTLEKKRAKEAVEVAAGKNLRP